MGELFEKPWAWALAVGVGLLLLMRSGRSGPDYSGVLQTNAVAADTNVKLSGIAAHAADSINQLRAHNATLAANHAMAELDTLRNGLSSSTNAILAMVVAKRDQRLAESSDYTARYIARQQEQTAVSAHATALKLGILAADNDAKAIALAPTLARINSDKVVKIAQFNSDTAIQQARYRYKAAKAGANAQMVGDGLDFVSGFF